MSGAWSSDFGGHADEGAHVVTSVMVRDYLGGGFLEEFHPIRYAEAYYEQFPKVAIGHYPPLFYLIASLFLLPFRSPEALLVLMAMTSAASGAMLAHLAGRILEGKIAPWALGMGWCLHPLVRTYTSIVMSDLLLVFFCLAAVASFARFQESRKLRDSIAFGVLSALAILTKGYGIVLALVPVFSILLTRDWALLRNFRLWAAALVVVVVAFPWMWLTRGITAEGMSEGGIFAQVVSAVPYYLHALPRELGWFLSFVLAASVVFLLITSLRPNAKIGEESRNSTAPLASAFAFLVSCIFCILLVPAGLDHRYLIPLLPVSLLISGWGVQRLIHPWQPRYRSAAVILLVTVLLFETDRPVEKRYTGARECIASVLSGASPEDGMTQLLAVSNARGEGALISAAVFQGADSLQVFRGSQTLAKSDWLGRGYTPTFDDSSGLHDLFVKRGVDFIVYDEPVLTAWSPSHWKEFPRYLLEMPLQSEIVEIETHQSRRKHGQKTVFHVFEFTPRQKEAETEP